MTLGGTGKDTGKRHPTLGNDVLVGCGAKILGPFTVGDGARIGGNAVVVKEVPPGCTVVGVPGTIVKGQPKPTEHPAWDLDQVSLPDPIQQELDNIRKRLDQVQQVCMKRGGLPADGQISGSCQDSCPNKAQ